MFGWSGQILHIDLTKKKVVKEQTAPHAKEFIGGRGINIELLYKGIKPGIDPLSPENILILGTGASGDILSAIPKMYLSCLLYTSPSPRDLSTSRMPSSA